MQPVSRFALDATVLSCVAALVVAAGIRVPVLAAGPDAPSFGLAVRPLLTEKCIRCHGPDSAEAGLDLSSAAKATALLDSGAIAIVPGDAGKSAVLERVSSQDPDVRMPPGDEEPLTAEQIEILSSWIDAGARYEEHWAFRPLAKTAVPMPPPERSARAGGGRARQPAQGDMHPIDAFVRVRLAQQGIMPSPPADPYTLFKRVHFDLVGLLPTPEEVAAFVADPSDAAYEAVVDRLLASPHFGERWGRHWLDLARYADSDGYEKDGPRPDAYLYRDWVIDAFNENMPFDEFTVRQLAGDLLRNETTDALVATAFNRQTLTNMEAGVDQEEFRVGACMDRTDTMGSVWLGLTVACAKCHSHKYDPISHAEYFSLYAFFNDADESVMRLPIEPGSAAGLDAKLALLWRALSVRERAIAPAHQRWLEEQRALLESKPGAPLEVRPVDVAAVESAAGLTYLRREDGSWQASLVATGPQVAAAANAGGPAETAPEITPTPPEVDSLSCTLVNLPAEFTGIRLETLPDSGLPRGGAGLSADGAFVVTRLAADVVDARGTVLRPLPLQRAFADEEADGFAAAGVLAAAADPARGWGDGLAFDAPHHLQVRTHGRVSLAPGESVRLRIEERSGGARLLGRFRVRAVVGDWDDLHLPAKVATGLREYPEKRTSETRQRLFDHFAEGDAEWQRLKREIDAALDSAGARAMPVRILTTARLPRTTHRFDRGDFLSPAEAVEPGVPAVLPALRTATGERATRLDLARWLVGPTNPLTPRVIVNQWWCRLFGQGLVRSVGDFGTRGEAPSHPELLDWLAATYRDDLGWDTKALLKTILLSVTYRQSSANRPELGDADPGNALLARQNRLRVEAEIVRDLALGASGLLTTTIGGPSVFPPMPADLAALSYANNFTWKTSTGSDRYRRGMYTFFKRTVPHPTLMTFDCPDANLTCVIRGVSNTPLQALLLLNEESFVEASQALALGLVDGVERDDRERLRQATMRCLCRPARGAEIDRFADLLVVARRHYAAHPEAARALVAGYGSATAPDTETAAWIATLRVLLNLDEFITRE